MGWERGKPRGLYKRGQRDGLMPSRPREFLFCPHCGEDLEKLRPRKLGDLWSDPRGDTYWKGREVQLSDTDRVMLHSILTVRDFQAKRDVDRGHFVDKLTIAERAGLSVDSVNVRLSQLRQAFRSVDPEFDHIENEKGLGYRWRTHEKAPAVLARSRAPTPNRFVLYDDGQFIIALFVRVWVDPKLSGTMAYLRTLIEANGEFVHQAALAKAAGAKNENSVKIAMRGLRRRLEVAAEHGNHGAVIEAKQRHGYRLVLRTDRPTRPHALPVERQAEKV